jgi:phosphatidylserine decarboxylase
MTAWPAIAIELLAALLAALLVVFAWWRFYFFHRNPARTVPAGADPVCPADGTIVYVEDVDLGAGAPDAYHQRVREAFAVDGRWGVIATYLGIFDVHVVRAPIAGTIRLRHMEPVGDNTSMGVSFLFAALRRPLPVGQRRYLDKNEFLGVEIAGGIRVLLVLMADWWIDQIVPLVADGAHVERGQVIGRIRMGSQVDLWAEAGVLRPARAIGERVRAGEMLMAGLAAPAQR